MYNLVPFRNNTVSRLLGTLFSAPEPTRSDDDGEDEEQKGEDGAAITAITKFLKNVVGSVKSTSKPQIYWWSALSCKYIEVKFRASYL